MIGYALEPVVESEMSPLGTRIALAGSALALCLAPAATAGGNEKVSVKDFQFGPGKVKISKGEKVKWVNEEGTHTVTFDNGYNEVLMEGDETGRRFKKPGTYQYLCTFHDDQGMKGKVIVR